MHSNNVILMHIADSLNIIHASDALKLRDHECIAHNDNKVDDKADDKVKELRSDKKILSKVNTNAKIMKIMQTDNAFMLDYFD